MEEKKPPQVDPKDIEENKVIAAISYIWILFLVPLFLKKESKFAQFHAKQGLVLFIAWLFALIPVIGWLIALVVLILAIIGFLKALTGEYWEIPVMGQFAKKLNL